MGMIHRPASAVGRWMRGMACGSGAGKLAGGMGRLRVMWIPGLRRRLGVRRRMMVADGAARSWERPAEVWYTPNPYLRPEGNTPSPLSRQIGTSQQSHGSPSPRADSLSGLRPGSTREGKDSAAQRRDSSVGARLFSRRRASSGASLRMTVQPEPVGEGFSLGPAFPRAGGYERRLRDDQWMAAMRQPCGVRTSTISSAPAELMARSRNVPCVVLVDVAQATSPCTRTWVAAALAGDGAGELDVGAQVVRAVLGAVFHAAALQDLHVRASAAPARRRCPPPRARGESAPPSPPPPPNRPRCGAPRGPAPRRLPARRAPAPRRAGRDEG